MRSTVRRERIRARRTPRVNLGALLTNESSTGAGRAMRKFDFYAAAADERGLVRWYNLLGKLWLRGIARVLEYSTRLHRRSLNLSRISDQLVVGGSVPTWAYGR